MSFFQTRSGLVGLAVAILIPGAFAQPTPPTIFVASWQCDRTAMDELVKMDREQALPIYQELVDEGLIWSRAVAVHNWGDEWNYLTFTLADDLAAGIAAEEEFGRRAEERYGSDQTFINHCPTHRDNIYVGAYTTSSAQGFVPEPPFTLALSYFNCPLNAINGIVQVETQTMLPAAQASVDAGMGYWHSTMRHSWADEWTYIHVRAARDVGSLVAFAADTARRVEEAGGDDTGPTDVCPAHKDNIYQVVVVTGPRAE